MPTVSESSTAITLDAQVGDLSTPPGTALNAVAIVEGSGPQITTETATLLRTRLRAAAGLLFLAFGSFFSWRLLFSGIQPSVDFAFHFAVTAVLGTSFFSLCRKCAISLPVLRAYELAIFGLTTFYFVYQQYWVSKVLADRGMMNDQLAPWVGTVFIYALFIPNRWRRAVVILGAMCAAPVLLTVYLWWADAAFGAAMASHRMSLVEPIIIMGVTFLASTYGTHVINALREEAFEAKQLGQYRLVNLIGAGGMGEVYLSTR